jgi:hypothetical protein
MQGLRIRFVPGRYAISRLAAHADIPDWLNGPGFRAVIHADDEVTLICLEDRVPAGITAETGWACLRTLGPFPFDAAGIVQSLIAPLSSDGEHVLIPAHETDRARRLLETAGHVVER